MQLLKLISISCICITLVMGCSSEPKPPALRGDGKGGTANLSELKELTGDSSGLSDTNASNSIRNQGIQETAMSVGAQSGLAWRTKQINAVLEKQDAQLRRVFDFNALLLNSNVLPPVLSEGRDTLKLDDSNTIRLADRSYKIISQARFITTPPSWREYLGMHFDPPSRPDSTLLPRTPAEQRIWQRYVELGWNEGIAQANNIFEENLARLKRDYKGMALYRSLLSQGMVSLPFVAKTNLGVTGNGQDMRVNDQVLRITALPELQTNSRQWKPAITPGETSNYSSD